MIEASPPEDKPDTGNLLQNVNAVFNYLFAQAQSVDLYSGEKAEVFILRPERVGGGGPSFAETFNFSPDSIKAAINRGKQDATSNRPNFYQSPGEPCFMDEDCSR